MSKTDHLLDGVFGYLSEPRCAVLSTIGPDGGPHPAVVHYMLESDALVVNGRADRLWLRNLARSPRVSFVVHDVDRPLHWIGIKGEAEILREGEAAVADAMTIARRYGEDPNSFKDQQRISFRITPRSVYEYPG